MFDHERWEGGECEVCGAEHDPEIHEATLRIHHWFHDEVTRYLFDEADVAAWVA